MIKKRKFRFTAVAISIMLSLAAMSETFAFAGTGSAQGQEEMIAGTIEDVTGMDEINEEIDSTKKEAAVADGYDTEITIPRDGKEAIVMDDGQGTVLEMLLPQEARDTEGILTDGGTIVYGTEDASAAIGVQPLQERVGSVNLESVRTAICIADADAPKSYHFQFNLKDGQRLVTAADYLGEEYDTGEVYVIDDDGKIQSVIDPAWAKDANGKDVDTYYEVWKNMLIQVVNFDENTVFPVVADPTAWQVTKCAGAISWAVGSTIFGAAKLLKVKKYIKALGGVKKAAGKYTSAIKLAKKQAKKAGSRNWRKYLKRREIAAHFGSSLLGFAGAVSGVDQIVNKCNF